MCWRGPWPGGQAHADSGSTRSRYCLPLPRSASRSGPGAHATELGGIAMTTARDIMHAGAECIGESQTLQHAARLMRDLDVGALPVCGADGRLLGIVTDRDIVVKCVAAGARPGTGTVRELARARPVASRPAARAPGG